MTDRTGFQPLSREDNFEPMGDGTIRSIERLARHESERWAAETVEWLATTALHYLARVEELERERAEYEAGNLWVKRAAAEQERAEAAEQRVRELREALVRLEEPCPDCDGEGCEWCGLTGFVFRDPSEMQEIRRAALAAVPAEPAAKP